MKIVRTCLGAVRKSAWFILAAMLANSVVHASTEETFPVLRTKTATYTNVTVTTKDRSYIFIVHSAGMNSIKIADLPNDVREQLGYIVPVDPVKTNRFKFTAFTSDLKSGTNGVAVFARELSGLGDKMKPFQAEWQARLDQSNIQMTPQVM